MTETVLTPAETVPSPLKTRIKRVMRIPALVLLLAMAVTLSATLDIPNYVKATESRGWPTAIGLVRRSILIRTNIGRDPAWLPFSVYSYRVNGVEYVNDVTNYQKEIGLPGYEANVLKKRYDVGTIVDVYYNPKNPQDSCLEPLGRPFEVVMHFIVFLMFGALVYLSCYVFVVREGSDKFVIE